MPKKRTQTTNKEGKITLLEPFWERQPGEPMFWYRRFNRYLKQGLKRSILGVYKQERVPDSRNKRQDKARKGLIKSPPHAWSDKAEFYQWRIRASAYDEKRLAEEHERWLEERQKTRLHMDDIGTRLMERAEKMLEFPLSKIITKEKRIEEDGKTIIYQTTIINPARWSMRDAAILSDVGARLQRLATGSPTSIKELNHYIAEGTRRRGPASLFPLIRENNPQTERNHMNSEQQGARKREDQ